FYYTANRTVFYRPVAVCADIYLCFFRFATSFYNIIPLFVNVRQSYGKKFSFAFRKKYEQNGKQNLFFRGISNKEAKRRVKNMGP
ncbi:MAG: hypothetical protein K2L51_02295, partial [Clostridiales bacterium]|nr:hypothetical protein [Clostridiales bacterium]